MKNASERSVRLIKEVRKMLNAFRDHDFLTCVAGLLELAYKWGARSKVGGQKEGILSKNLYFEGILVKF